MVQVYITVFMRILKIVFVIEFTACEVIISSIVTS